jgi:hypothetical protein
MLARLLDIIASALYLGDISEETVRGLVRDGELTPVRLPSTRRPGTLSRRLLFDVRNLDALIDKWKQQSTSAPHPGLSAAALKGWKSSPVRLKKKGAA